MVIGDLTSVMTFGSVSSEMATTLQRWWERVCVAAGGDHWTLYIIGSWGISFGIFLFTNIAFGCLDIFGMPRILRRFKIQKEKNVPMSLRKYGWAVVVATFNMTVMVIANQLVLWHAIAKHRMRFHYSEMPSLCTALCQIAFCIILHDIAFYYVHRLLHSPFLYKHIHKMHHNWTAPCSIATFYCHPIEHLAANLFSYVLGPAIVGAHLSTAWLYWSLGIVSTTLAHCGYHFPFFPSSQAHDFHHQKYTDQFSTLGVLDWMHSTNKSYKKSINYKRHFTICGFAPADELVKS